ncbi:MAG: Fe-S oxidoreductases of moaA/nifB/pqqE family, partial [uncultured Solirubrobacteraceae bacterium]
HGDTARSAPRNGILRPCALGHRAPALTGVPGARRGDRGRARRRRGAGPARAARPRRDPARGPADPPGGAHRIRRLGPGAHARQPVARADPHGRRRLVAPGRDRRPRHAGGLGAAAVGDGDRGDARDAQRPGTRPRRRPGGLSLHM